MSALDNLKYSNDCINLQINHDSNGVESMLNFGELMLHQSKFVKASIDIESAQFVKINTDENHTLTTSTNRHIIELEMGAGKTTIAIGIILKSPKPPMKQVYFVENGNILQERFFNENRAITPTIIVVRHSVYSQWLDDLMVEFKKERIFEITNSRSTNRFINMVHDDLDNFNSNYDVVLMNYKSISGKVDDVLKRCDALFSLNENRNKRIHTLTLNALSRHYIRRIIYDDWDMINFHWSPMENAGSCIYMSATCNYSKISHVNAMSGDITLDRQIEFATYAFNRRTFRNIITIRADRKFLDESIELGLVSQGNKNMMPGEPEVYICHINNRESAAINIIDTLCDDQKIMEGINSLAVTSLADTIQSLLAERFEPYQKAITILAHYETMNIEQLVETCPPPPPGTQFTIHDIMNCMPIEYAYRNIVDRVNTVVANSREIVANEIQMIDRVKSHLIHNSCPICMEEIKTEVAGIMKCCNGIIHATCALRCRSQSCPFCRAPYGRTAKDTFAILHHTADFSALTTAVSDSAMLDILTAEVKEEVEITKLSVLAKLLHYDFANVDMERVYLRHFSSLVYDSKSDEKCNTNPDRMKTLIYCSANDTLHIIESELANNVDYKRLTASSAATHKKIMHFRSSTKPTALLANAWGDAAGIDFKMATDIVIINYIESPATVQQMLGRLLRMGGNKRARVCLISFTNERYKWLQQYVTSEPSV